MPFDVLADRKHMTARDLVGRRGGSQLSCMNEASHERGRQPHKRRATIESGSVIALVGFGRTG